VVAATSVEVGDMATPGRELVTVFDPRELRVVATVPQATLTLWKRDLRSSSRSRRCERC